MKGFTKLMLVVCGCGVLSGCFFGLFAKDQPAAVPVKAVVPAPVKVLTVEK